MDPLVVPVHSSSATTKFDDNTMAYNAMKFGPLNDKARNRWESWIVWGVILPKAVKLNVANHQTPTGKIVEARDAKEM